jgi:hypothetical protein
MNRISGTHRLHSRTRQPRPSPRCNSAPQTARQGERRYDQPWHRRPCARPTRPTSAEGAPPVRNPSTGSSCVRARVRRSLHDPGRAARLARGERSDRPSRGRVARLTDPPAHVPVWASAADAHTLHVLIVDMTSRARRTRQAPSRPRLVLPPTPHAPPPAPSRPWSPRRASIIAAQLLRADGGALAQRMCIHQLPQITPRVAGLIESVFGDSPGTQRRCRRRVGWRENGGKPDSTCWRDNQ